MKIIKNINNRLPLGEIFQKSLWWQHGPGVIRKFKIIGSGTQVPCQRLQERRTTRMTSCITKALLIYYRVHAYPDQLRFIFFAGSWIIWTYMVSLFSFSSSNRQMSLYRSVFVFDELIPASTKMIQPIALIKSLASHSSVWAAPFLSLRSISCCSSRGRYFTASIFQALVAMCMENVI